MKNRFGACCAFLWLLVVCQTLPASQPAEKRGTALFSDTQRFMFKQSIFEQTMGKSSAFTFAAQDNSASQQIDFASEGRKSRGRAFLQSLLIPGWGQYYARSKSMLKVFVVSEVVLWGTFAGFKTWSNWLEDDFRTFAAEHAGVQVQGKPSRFFVDIGNFNSVEDFNQAQLRDRDVNDLYPETEEFFWQWDSEANRLEFDDLRVRSDRADNRADLTIAAIVVNHLASAIQATLATYRFNKRLQSKKLGLNLDVRNQLTNTTYVLTLSKYF